jgi:protocatechuate 3,4-dioxygenase beta subunit
MMSAICQEFIPVGHEGKSCTCDIRNLVYENTTTMRSTSVLSVALIATSSACAQTFDACEDCQLVFEGMPNDISSTARLAPPDEPGEALTIEGVIYMPDGKTPAPGIILYVYHTDAKGLYSQGKGQTKARRHGHLRGWMKSDSKGRYSFTTIRPASYPNSRNPQHIHPILVESPDRYYWIDEYHFNDDPVLTAEERSRQKGRGGYGIITLTRDGHGWKGVRNIILGKGVPNYTQLK